MSIYNPIPDGANATPSLFNTRFASIVSLVEASASSVQDLYAQGVAAGPCGFNACTFVTNVSALTTSQATSNASIAALQASATSSAASVASLYSASVLRPAGGNPFDLLEIGVDGAAIWSSSVVLSALSVQGVARIGALQMPLAAAPSAVAGSALLYASTSTQIGVVWPDGSHSTIG